ncbi:uncharacterized protein LOC128301237 [Anopheles moucheti]|uniref:uncharacterized protein LOC128301237 n=1 Tax=Anopheles moucheti TaxID=186751 RepID=UPI0022F0FFA8|nr:uncharacterized protein LOC128301237 [Anopheles moucheti]
MLPSKQSNTYMSKIYTLDPLREIQMDHEPQTSKQQPTAIKIECDSDDEKEYDIFATTDESFRASLNMTCSDSEEPTEGSAEGGSVFQTRRANDRPATTEMRSGVGIQNGSSMKEFIGIEFMNMFRSLSKQIASMHNKIDRVHKEVSSNSERLERVERKLGISLQTMEQVKKVIVLLDATSENQQSQENPRITPEPLFNFEKITNEDEFTKFDTKLGMDEEYYSDIKKGFRMQIHTNDPGNRMHEVIDMIFDRSFMPLCSWTGNGKLGKKIAFGARKNILKLFADIGSNPFMAVNELYIETFFKNKLRHAKQRVNLKGIVKTGCHKRKSNHDIALANETSK